jgi:hypothetical protein
MWITGPVECRICGYKGIAVMPVGCDWSALECANCHNMTCELTDIPEELIDYEML